MRTDTKTDWVLFLCGVVLLVWAFLTDGFQPVPAFIGGFLLAWSRL